ncbi:MAG: hypothetical protein ACRCZF_07290, partial [Gemmataceae bacterium]
EPIEPDLEPSTNSGTGGVLSAQLSVLLWGFVAVILAVGLARAPRRFWPEWVCAWGVLAFAAFGPPGLAPLGIGLLARGVRTARWMARHLLR